MLPKNEELLLPVLKACAKGTVSVKEIMPAIADEFNLTEEDCAQLIPRGNIRTGRQTRFGNRVYWAKVFLKQAGLVHYPEPNKFAITEEGEMVLQSKPKYIDKNYLKKYESFREFLVRSGVRKRIGGGGEPENRSPDTTDGDRATPQEQLQSAYQTIRDNLASDLLDQVRNSTPQFFEKLIVNLLVEMGYGGAAPDAGRVLGGSGDDGVDGVIDQDLLGVDRIYIQAKRYNDGNNVGPGAIREFAGALTLKQTHKGIFFTSSSFSPSARNTAENLGTIVLIDGIELANLMIDYNIGCREEERFLLKEIDNSFFEEK